MLSCLRERLLPLPRCLEEIFIFTTAKLDYTERILEVLDPQKKLIRHRLYQDDCLCVRGHYLKDLAVLGRDLAKTVALDHSLQAYPYQVSNRVPIPSWHGDPQDQELLRLIPVLEKLSQAVRMGAAPVLGGEAAPSCAPSCLCALEHH
ncbi:PREDICTED: CTD small phosphatase-like protein 2 [Gavialis gangeticus]|uniref:CTD small phosphatase-like protein 2 n=1 Tax=Gavialis gangeticus TaxID=94835 RepID=UPI00092EC4AC|nr:PREDICTED: CTD small phosphatase-like protein 2 [Gavialis gangeticus]